VKAIVHVVLKPAVLDPQGKAIQRASRSLGYDSIREVRQGKLFEVTVDEDDEQRARALVEELCQKLLSNPVIEDYSITALEP
jgi:phosphoribosylformylglycinamidine synthase